MALNLVDICTVKYPGQIEAGNITFRKPGEDILFASWKVEGIPQPSEQEIMAEAAQWQKASDIQTAFLSFVSYIENLLNSTALSKQYGSALSIATYVTSSNPQWAAEAEAFIKWRDDVFVYSIDIQTRVIGGQIPIPTLDEFTAGLPTITWPS
jgi:hypothetical protein